MTIFKYTMIKYLKSWSTWIILALGVFLAGIGGGFLPYHFLSTNRLDSATNYSVVIISIVAGVTSFLSIFISIFAGFKAAQMFKDEVEDGTFLIILSKPITRSKIILWKWIALQTLVLSYTFITTLSFAVATSIFDTGDKISGLDIIGIKTLSSQIWIVSLVIWGILSLFGLIFTSIALLLSTKLSTGTTIGISIAIGVVIPITNIVSLFTHKQAYKSYTNSNLNKKEIIINSWKERLDKHKGIIASLPDVKSLEKSYEDLFKKARLENNIRSQDSLYNLGYKTGEWDGFKTAWPFDLNFHVSYISTFASNLIIPKAAKDIIYSSDSNKAARRSLLTAGRIVEKNKLNNKPTTKINDLIHDKTIYNLAKNSLSMVEDLRIKVWKLISNNIKWLSGPKYSKKLYNVIIGDSLEKIQSTFGLDVDKMIQDKLILLGASKSSYSLQNFRITNEGLVHIIKRIKDFFDKINQSNFLTSPYNVYTTKWKNTSQKQGEVITNVSSNDALKIIKKVGGNINYFWKIANPNKRDFMWNGKDSGTNHISVFNYIFDMMKSAFNNKELIESKDPIFIFSKFLIDSFNELLQPIDSYFVDYYLEDEQMKNFDLEKIDTKYKWLNDWSNELGLSDMDSKIFKKLNAIYYQNPNFLVKIKRKLYVDKNYLLYFYLSLALILVPLSYWTTRKQDYR